MIVKRVVAGIYGANCYLIKDEKTGKGFVIDPGGDVDDILKVFNTMPFEVEYILFTHGHLDHTTGGALLQTEVGGIIAISEEDDKYILANRPLFGPLLPEGADKHLVDGEKIKVGEMEIECIATPGHTPGGMCYKVGNEVFTGDTLFRRSIGRTDFEGGDYNALEKSILEKLYTLPDDTIVYPGHNISTTIGEEKTQNIGVRI